MAAGQVIAGAGVVVIAQGGGEPELCAHAVRPHLADQPLAGGLHLRVRGGVAVEHNSDRDARRDAGRLPRLQEVAQGGHQDLVGALVLIEQRLAAGALAGLSRFAQYVVKLPHAGGAHRGDTRPCDRHGLGCTLGEHQRQILGEVDPAGLFHQPAGAARHVKVVSHSGWRDDLHRLAVGVDRSGCSGLCLVAGEDLLSVAAEEAAAGDDQ